MIKPGDTILVLNDTYDVIDGKVFEFSKVTRLDIIPYSKRRIYYLDNHPNYNFQYEEMCCELKTILKIEI
jgi:hypothetical protein